MAYWPWKLHEGQFVLWDPLLNIVMDRFLARFRKDPVPVMIRAFRNLKRRQQYLVASALTAMVGACY